VVCCYAPMRSARRMEKFYICIILSSITSEEKYVLIGDFNAHVGST